MRASLWLHWQQAARLVDASPPLSGVPNRVPVNTVSQSKDGAVVSRKSDRGNVSKRQSRLRKAMLAGTAALGNHVGRVVSPRPKK